MSARSMEKYWVEFKVIRQVAGSKKKENLISIRIDDDELEVSKNDDRGILQSIMRRQEPSMLFERRIPIYLKDVIGQVFQEVKIESNPIRISLLLNKKAGQLISEFLEEQGLKLKGSKGAAKNGPGEVNSKESKSDFHRDLYKKAIFSELEKAIVLNEDEIEDLVYLFRDQTILKNFIFFKLFQHWFKGETSEDVKKIQRLINALKRQANIGPGPKTFSEKKKREIIFKYEYVRRIIKNLKKNIETPKSVTFDNEINEKWAKLESFFAKNNYFNLTKEVADTRERLKGYKVLDYIGCNWLENNLSYFLSFYLFNRGPDEINQEIEDYKKEKLSLSCKSKGKIEKEARLKYLKSISRRLGLKRTADLELDIKAENYDIRHLYKRHALNEIEDIEVMSKKIENLKEPESRKALQTIDPTPLKKYESLRALKKNKPSDLSFFFLSKVYGETPRRIERVVEDNKSVRARTSSIIRRYTHLQAP